MRVNASTDREIVQRGCKAFLDGVDVSRDCFEVDDEAGYVLLYKTTPEGRKLRDGDEAAWERREGQVRIEVNGDD